MMVAIDGPAGAGKSSVAKAAARQLGFIYVDTGALYRAVGLAMRLRGVNTKDQAAVAAVLPRLSLRVLVSAEGQRIVVDGKDVSRAIRHPSAAMAASDMGANPAVREYLLGMQRSLARRHDSILDGRDIGTVVLPEAEVKIFLTADPRERARRRWQQDREAGIDSDFDEVLAQVLARDEQDTQRAVAPLKAADDSILLDSTSLTAEETIAAVIEIIEARSARNE